MEMRNTVGFMESTGVGDGWSNVRRVDGRSGRLRIIQAALDEAVGKCAVSCRDIIDEDPRSWSKENDLPPWRLRARDVPLSANGTGVSENEFYNKVLMSVHECRRAMELTWPNGQWELLAWSVSPLMKQVRVRVPNTNAGQWSIFDEDPTSPGHGKPNPQRTKQGYGQVEYLAVTMVFVDAARNDEFDHLEEHGRKGPMARYISTWDYRYVPRSVRKQCDRGMDVVSQFVADPESPSEEGLTERQVELAMKARTRGVPLRDIGEMLGVQWRIVRDALPKQKRQRKREDPAPDPELVVDEEAS